MATKTFNASFMGQYKASSNSYHGGGSPVRVGTSANYQSFIGIPTTVRDAMNTSTTTPTLKMKMYVYDASPEWDFGAHKETYNKASGTMPWYTYLKAFHYAGTGWLEFDLSGSVFGNAYKAGTYHGVVLYTSSSYPLGEAYNTSTYPVQFVVTGTWNSPPNSPVITYPTGGEVVDSGMTVKWNKPTDPDGDTLTYRVAFNSGSGWRYYTTTALTYYIGMSGEPETSNAQVAVQSFDGEEYSPYTYSAKFSINHNSAPSAPTNMSPVNGALLNRTGGIRFSWKHNDDGAQAGYRINWRLKGNTTWNYIPSSTSFTNSTNQYYDMPANTLPFGDIEWQVRTKDQANLESPLSTMITFKASNASNAPVILSPTNMSTINTSTVNISWSSLNQLEYEVILYDTNGLTLWSRSASGSTKSVTPAVTLANNTWYEAHVRVKDSTTLIWSDWSVSAFGTSFTPPAQPVINSYEEAGEGVVNIFYSFTSGGASTESIDMLRREYTSTGTAEWVTIGKDLPVAGSFLDYTPASGVTYEYMAKANGGNGTSSESFPILVTISFSGAFIQEAHNLSGINFLRLVNSREETLEIESELAKFAGRKDPVREFGEHETLIINIEWEVDTFAEVRAMRELMRVRDVLLYRDGQGRRLWVTSGEIEVTDKPVRGFVLSIELTQTSFTEDLNTRLNEELI